MRCSGHLPEFSTLIILIGVLSVTTEDYLIASRGVNPWLSALSAMGTNNSGSMLIGMIGYTYRLGIESVWMMVGIIVSVALSGQLSHL